MFPEDIFIKTLLSIMTLTLTVDCDLPAQKCALNLLLYFNRTIPFFLVLRWGRFVRRGYGILFKPNKAGLYEDSFSGVGSI